MTKRNTFNELMDGIKAMKQHRESKITLRTHAVEEAPLPKVTATDIRKIREHAHMSQTVFAQKLRVSPRTFQKWEQGVAAPNEQAKLLILLAEKYPDTMERIASLTLSKRKAT